MQELCHGAAEHASSLCLVYASFLVAELLGTELAFNISNKPEKEGGGNGAVLH